MNSRRRRRRLTLVMRFINGKSDLQIKNAMSARSTSSFACSSGLASLGSSPKSTTKRGYGSLRRPTESKNVEHMATFRFSWAPFSTAQPEVPE